MSHYIQSRKRQPITQRQTELLSLTTKKEQQVLSLVCQGLSNERIAANLSISINTVKMHIQNIFKKTNVSSRGSCFTSLHRYRGVKKDMTKNNPIGYFDC